MKIHHIGYLVKNIMASKNAFESLGFIQESEIVNDSQRGVNICFMVNNRCRIELVSPADSSSVVSGLCKKIGNAPYHICYESNCYPADVAELKNAGFGTIIPPQRAPAINNLPVTFLISPNIGMIEVIDLKEYSADHD